MIWTSEAWHLWGAAQPTPRRPSAVELALARVRHPSFTPEVADELVRALSRPQLRRLWTESGRLLDGKLDDQVRFRVVVLRARILDQADPVPD